MSEPSIQQSSIVTDFGLAFFLSMGMLHYTQPATSTGSAYGDGLQMVSLTVPGVFCALVGLGLGRFASARNKSTVRLVSAAVFAGMIAFGQSV